MMSASSRFVLSVLASVAMVAISAGASYAGPSVDIVRPPENQRMANLELKLASPDPGKAPARGVIVEGKFDRDGWNLISGSKWLVDSGAKKSLFRYEVPVKGATSTINLVAIGPMGEIEKEAVVVEISDREGAEVSSRQEPPRRFNFNSSLGYTNLAYSETDIESYSMHGLTAKLGVQYLLAPPAWDLGFSAYGTVTPLSDNQADVDARFFGVNLRVGYSLPFVPEPWKVSLMAGSYYTTMLVTDRAFGFKNMAGPQVFPVVRRAFAGGSSVSSYFKFSPIMNGLSILAFDHREIAGGLGYVRPLKNGHPLIFGLDAADLKLALGEVTIHSRSLSFSVGYGF